MNRLSVSSAEEIVNRLGYRSAELVGEGMEGAVFGVSEDLVAKVWFGATFNELQPRQYFYNQLSTQRLPFQTPCIEDMIEINPVLVTLERRLPGTTLKSAMEQKLVSTQRAIDVSITVVRSLSETVAVSGAYSLPVMDEKSAFRGTKTWVDAVCDIVRERGSRYRRILSQRVDDFENKFNRTIDGLQRMPRRADQIVHGDLVPENILVDKDGAIVGVIDWSFFTTAGDNTFEAGVSAGLFDMFGENRVAHDRDILTRLSKEFSYDERRMLIYRAAYSIATANAFGSDGADGHFAWCAGNLNRDDIFQALQSI